LKYDSLSDVEKEYLLTLKNMKKLLKAPVTKKENDDE